ncbi:DUF2059 domain-containing protein [Fibrobacterales bacterium]|nr:DUF2059 domain-containing protein [Fibrobacterales bacterium]
MIKQTKIILLIALLSVVALAKSSTDKNLEKIVQIYEPYLLELKQGLHKQVDLVRNRDNVSDSVIIKAHEYVESDALKKRYIEIWREAFTPKELKTLTKFLSTDLGQRFFLNSPIIGQIQIAEASVFGVDVYDSLQVWSKGKVPADNGGDRVRLKVKKEQDKMYKTLKGRAK